MVRSRSGFMLNADGQAGERVVIFGLGQHRSLIAEPPDIAEKHEDQQRSGADGNADLGLGEGHFFTISLAAVGTKRQDYRREARADMYVWRRQATLQLSLQAFHEV